MKISHRDQHDQVVILLIVVFCPNPGPLMNGRIYVVIRDERLSSTSIRKEFRSYIPTVIHGRTIEFECDEGEREPL